jgi:hypothetical protein
VKWLFLIGFIAFLSGAAISYLPTVKASVYYAPLWIVITLVSTLGWALVAKSTPDSSKLLVLGMYWDTLMQMTYLMLPVIAFGARLTMFQSAGVALIFSGLFMIRG